MHTAQFKATITIKKRVRILSFYDETTLKLISAGFALLDPQHSVSSGYYR